MSYYVYILLCEDDSLYTGITRDLISRFERHVSGTGAKYTRSHAPTRIVFTEKHENRSSALKREAAIKRLRRDKKIELVTGGTVCV